MSNYKPVQYGSVSKWYSTNDNRSSNAEYTLITREDGTMPILLFDLLREVSPYQHTDRVKEVITNELDSMDNVSYSIEEEEGSICAHIKGNTKVLFSCHFDTVQSPPLKGQDSSNIDLYLKQGMVYGAEKDGSPSILGADDKLGCYILLEMLRANIPGTYVFHEGEECGGIGSKKIKELYPSKLKTFDMCVAFDRKGYSDVIAYQGGQTASSKFTGSLASALNKCISTSYSNLLPPSIKSAKGVFEGNIRGLFTDSAVYSGLIPECSNISVGYHNAHSSNEHFDLQWLVEVLTPSIIKVDWNSLPIERIPEEPVKRVLHKYPGQHTKPQSKETIQRTLESRALGLNLAVQDTIILASNSRNTSNFNLTTALKTYMEHIPGGTYRNTDVLAKEIAEIVREAITSTLSEMQDKFVDALVECDDLLIDNMEDMPESFFEELRDTIWDFSGIVDFKDDQDEMFAMHPWVY